MKNNMTSCDENKIERLCNYIKGTNGINLVDPEIPEEHNYSCLPLCLIDAVYCINVHYQSVRNVIDNYCDKVHINKTRGVNSGTPDQEEHTIDDLIAVFKSEGSIENFESEIVLNRHKTSPNNGMPKAKALFECAQVLSSYGIHTISDFNRVMSEDSVTAEAFEEDFENVKGQSSGTFLNLKMLCWNENTFTPSRHIIDFISRALGYEVKKDEAERLLPEVTDWLKQEYPSLTLRTLDYAIWNMMSNEKK